MKFTITGDHSNLSKMLAPEHVQRAQQFLADADRELDAGDHFQASEKLWGAASHMIIAEMHRRGLKQSGHRAMINAIEQIAEDADEPSLRTNFAIAESLHANFYHGFMQPQDVRRHRSHIHEFVGKMNRLTNGKPEIRN
ncbi:MAG: hypothetical protein F4Y88_09665 [Chloroflexi bacterium]|nr:hypothetical protein [Chloroflexota bacterium]